MAALQETVYPDEISKLPMFHYISKEDAERVVRDYCRGEGTYLMRPGSSGDKNYFAITLSISHSGSIRHLKVNISRQEKQNRCKFRYYITRTRQFPTFLDFLRYYYRNPICCDDNISVRLLRGLGYTGEVVTTNGTAIKSPLNAAQSVQLIPRRRSEPRVTPSAGSRGGQSSGSPHHSRHQRSSEPTVAVAGLGASSPSATSGENYLNHEAIVRNPRHRPPPTIPKRPEDAFVPTYFEVNHKKNFFDETYNLLKESEMCECGLRTVDSTLPKGWTIHKIDSPDSDTKTIFFQNEEEVTTWEMPLEIVPLLTDSQILFILDLCQEIGCPVPSCLANADAGSVSSRASRTSSELGSSVSSLSSNVFLSESHIPSALSRSASSAFEEEDTEKPYELPSPLVIQSSSFITSTSAVAGQPSSQVSCLPSVSEDEVMQEGGVDDSWQGSSQLQQTQYPVYRGWADSITSAEGSCSSDWRHSVNSIRRSSFTSMNTETIQALTGPPSRLPAGSSTIGRSSDSARHS